MLNRDIVSCPRMWDPLNILGYITLSHGYESTFKNGERVFIPKCGFHGSMSLSKVEALGMKAHHPHHP